MLGTCTLLKFSFWWNRETRLFCFEIVFVTFLLPPASTASENCECKETTFYFYSLDLKSKLKVFIHSDLPRRGQSQCTLRGCSGRKWSHLLVGEAGPVLDLGVSVFVHIQSPSVVEPNFCPYPQMDPPGSLKSQSIECLSLSEKRQTTYVRRYETC